ncbi:MAG TPA: hypothetical protein P5562_02150, partial [Candidatus Woesebacteria bacterium]|nr:hypothetical protein [Candidatus Woesebacteria bacterium]
MSLFYSLSLLGKFWQEKMNHFMVRGTIFCILGQIIVLFFTFSNLPTQVPLYYTLPWGESRLAPVANLFLFPLLSVLVLVVDSLMAMYYSR